MEVMRAKPTILGSGLILRAEDVANCILFPWNV